jgi:hypothetical protein
MIIELVTQVTQVTSLPWILPLYLIVGGLFKDAVTQLTFEAFTTYKC